MIGLELNINFRFLFKHILCQTILNAILLLFFSFQTVVMTFFFSIYFLFLQKSAVLQSITHENKKRQNMTN